MACYCDVDESVLLYLLFQPIAIVSVGSRITQLHLMTPKLMAIVPVLETRELSRCRILMG
jgi:hypothetical protein